MIHNSFIKNIVLIVQYFKYFNIFATKKCVSNNYAFLNNIIYNIFGINN